MTRGYRGSETSASRRALLPIVGAVPLAVGVICSSATGHAAARPSVPAPALSEQIWTGPARPGVTPRAIGTSAAWGPDRVQYGVTTLVLAPGSGLHPVPVDSSYPDRVTGLTVNSGIAGLIIGTAVAAIPAAVVGAVPGALIGAAVGAIAGGIAGGVATGIPTLGVGAPVGAVGGALAGAGVGAAVGAVVGAVAGAVPTGIVGAGVGYALGAATGTGNGQQS